MSQCALAVYEWDKWGHKWPRRWMAKHGGLSIAHAVEDDPNEFKEYRSCRTQCENSMRRIPPSEIHNWPGAIIQ